MSRSRKARKLDEIDIRLLAEVQRNGRLSKLALAERVHLSPTACWTRLKRLETDGVIRGYHAEVSLSRLAPFTVIWTEVSLHTHRRQDFRAFESTIESIPEIVECWATGGGIDYLLKVLTRDIESYQVLIDRLLDADVGIDRYFTYVVTKTVKQSRELPLYRLLSPGELES